MDRLQMMDFLVKQGNFYCICFVIRAWRYKITILNPLKFVQYKYMIG
jgi:hypothetical protein